MNIYEHRSHPLLPWPKFLRLVGRHFLVALVVIGLALGVGVAGYHWLGGLGWIDSLLNASMILGGMGPVDPLKSDVAKIFASLYALVLGPGVHWHCRTNAGAVCAQASSSRSS